MRRLIVKLMIVLITLAGIATAIEGTKGTTDDNKKAEAQASGTKLGEYTISGPYIHENLAIYLIRGKDKIKDTKFVTLQEALQQKKVTIFETGAVNTLTVENTSDDVYIYIHSGDIVRGGKQDRTVGYDYIIPPKSSKLPLSSFCVERGRWRRRGKEPDKEFSISNNQLNSRSLKLAAKYDASQADVWSEVAKTQEKLSENLGKSVKSGQSPSSLELTLENQELQKATQNYTNALLHLPEGKKNVVGYAFAINGELNSADIYASSALFRQLWPKLLKAIAVESIAERQKKKQFNHPDTEAVKAFLQDAEKGEVTQKQINEKIRMIIRETKKNMVFETYWTGEREALHKNYIHKDKFSQMEQPTRTRQIIETRPQLQQRP